MRLSLLFALFLYSIAVTAQIEGTDLDPTTSIHVEVENGTVESVTYYRLNYFERLNFQSTVQRSRPMVLEDFIPFAYTEKAR